MNNNGYRLDMTFMFTFHNALRRELDQLARVTTTTSDDPDIMATAPGWQMFKSYLGVHHSCEDDTLWPVMEKALSERPDDLALLAALEAEHAAIDPLFRAIDATVANPASGRERLGDLTDALATTVNAHLRHEETEGLPLIDATVTEEQWQNFGEEHSKRMGSEAPRALPWVLEGADKVTTDHILQGMPEPVRTIYRDEWLPAYRQSGLWGGARGRS
jgi:hemerythrin-like domain-containing protein